MRRSGQKLIQAAREAAAMAAARRCQARSSIPRRPRLLQPSLIVIQVMRRRALQGFRTPAASRRESQTAAVPITLLQSRA